MRASMRDRLRQSLPIWQTFPTEFQGQAHNSAPSFAAKNDAVFLPKTAEFNLKT
jgi:hypothetical protein